jgi:hypothetical protein
VTRKAARLPVMRCLSRLLTEWVLDALDRIRLEGEVGRPMFTHVVGVSGEPKQVKMEASREVLELFLTGDRYGKEEDVFVTMMSYGVVLVVLVLVWVRLVDVVYY